MFLALAFTCLTNISFAQTKQQDVQNVITVLNIKPAMQNMVSGGINLYKSKRPLVSQAIWDDIVSMVDYTPYLNKVAVIFDKNYTQPELKHLITLATNAKPGKQPKFKPAVKTALYNAGNEFGKDFANLINLQLKMKGY